MTINAYNLRGAPAVNLGLPGLPARKANAVASAFDISNIGRTTYQGVGNLNNNSGFYLTISDVFLNQIVYVQDGMGVLIVSAFGYSSKILYGALAQAYRFDTITTVSTVFSLSAGSSDYYYPIILYPDGSGFMYGYTNSASYTGNKFNNPANPTGGYTGTGTLSLPAGVTIGRNEKSFFSYDMTKVYLACRYEYTLGTPGVFSSGTYTGDKGSFQPMIIPLPDGMTFIVNNGQLSSVTQLQIYRMAVKNDFWGAKTFRNLEINTVNASNLMGTVCYQQSDNMLWLPFFVGTFGDPASFTAQAGVASFKLG